MENDLPLVDTTYSLDNTIMKVEKENQNDEILDESGQTFLEFVLLLATMVLLSFTLMNGFNKGISELWKSYIQAIANPTDTNIDYQ